MSPYDILRFAEKQRASAILILDEMLSDPFEKIWDYESSEDGDELLEDGQQQLQPPAVPEGKSPAQAL